MSRLASFKGPSTPTSSPVPQRTVSNPASPQASRSAESPFHRKTRTLLQELRSISQNWDDLILVEGLKAARQLVDTRTELDNALALVPNRRPRTFLVGPKVELMEKRIVQLDEVIVKLRKHFKRMNTIIDNLESLISEAHKAKGWHWVINEPLWTTWPLEKFVKQATQLLVPYHRCLHEYVTMVDTLRSHSISFEESRDVINKWITLPWISDSGWDAVLEDICSVEVERWTGR